MTQWWRWYAAFGAVGCAVYFVIPSIAWARWWFVVVGASAVIAIVVGTAHYRPPRRPAWLAIAAGAGLWVLGDAVYAVVAAADGPGAYRWLPDLVYLLGYPVYGYGLFLLVRRPWNEAERGHVANSAIITIAFGLVVWVFGVQPSLDGSGVGDMAGLVVVAYPAMDVFLLGLLAHFIGARNWRARSYRLLTAAVALLVVTDTISNFAILASASSGRAWTDAGWVVSYLLIGIAALHPSMREISSPSTEPERHLIASLTAPTVAVLTAAALTAPLVMTVQVIRQVPASQWGWAVLLCSVALLLLIMLRISELLRLLHNQAVRLRGVADTDHLTGLANRRALETWVNADTRALTLLTIDIDRFQEINDTFGRAIGDGVLSVVATRLRTITDSSAMLARLAGDEFALCIPSEHCDVAALTAAVRGQFATPVAVREFSLLIEVSIGVASAEARNAGDDAIAGALVQHADLAVQAAKTVQPRIATYDRSMDRDKSEQMILLAELDRALGSDELELWYQPQIELDTLKVSGVEALLRWNHPNRDVLQPDWFLPMAERTGLIKALTEFVLDRALEQRRQWARAGTDLRMAVNISTRNLLDPTLVDMVDAALTRFECPAGRLTLEITETSAMTDPQVAGETLAALRTIGVELAIDDYGTGYSSLAYLERLPVQELKIDKTFVSNLECDPAHEAIVRSTIELARTLGMNVTAEGVEDERTLIALRHMHCRRAQGFHIGRPTPGAEVLDLIANLDARTESSTGERIT